VAGVVDNPPGMAMSQDTHRNPILLEEEDRQNHSSHVAT
jgi:hypothetical protein